MLIVGGGEIGLESSSGLEDGRENDYALQTMISKP
jgi:hypothetical protein